MAPLWADLSLKRALSCEQEFKSLVSHFSLTCELSDESLAHKILARLVPPVQQYHTFCYSACAKCSYNVHGKTTQFIFNLRTIWGAHFVKILRVGAQKNLLKRAILVLDSLSHSYHCTFCLVLFLLKLSLFTNVNYCLVQKSGIYFWYRSNDMSSKTQGDGGGGLGWQWSI